MQATMLRGSAFTGSMRATPARSAAVSRAPTVVVKAVQDVKGVVSSAATNNTVVVTVERLAPHPKYFKRIRSTKRYMAQVDSTTECSVGDYVRLEGTRPLSAQKRFRVAEIIRAAEK